VKTEACLDATNRLYVGYVFCNWSIEALISISFLQIYVLWCSIRQTPSILRMTTNMTAKQDPFWANRSFKIWDWFLLGVGRQNACSHCICCAQAKTKRQTQSMDSRAIQFKPSRHSPGKYATNKFGKG